MKHLIDEPTFRAALNMALDNIGPSNFDYVVGPGRSGAIASAYASHRSGIPFVPWNQRIRGDKRRVLMVDTAMQTGKTMRRAVARYEKFGYEVTPLAVYNCPDTHFIFWFEGY